jgi:hypothetical protein
MGRPGRLPPQLQAWVDARRRFRLSDAQVAMMRELGLNLRKIGQLGNHRQEPWKAQLPVFIEELYLKRCGRTEPEVVVSIEEHYRLDQQRTAARRAARADRTPQPPVAEKMAGDTTLDSDGTSARTICEDLRSRAMADALALVRDMWMIVRSCR